MIDSCPESMRIGRPVRPPAVRARTKSSGMMGGVPGRGPTATSHHFAPLRRLGRAGRDGDLTGQLEPPFPRIHIYECFWTQIPHAFALPGHERGEQQPFVFSGELGQEIRGAEDFVAFGGGINGWGRLVGAESHQSMRLIGPTAARVEVARSMPWATWLAMESTRAALLMPPACPLTCRS